MHERKQEVYGQFLYHNRRLPAMKVWMRADVRLSGIDNTIAAP